MRIIKLQLTNLNALYGTFNINFAHAQFIEEGIFAITGPTGAGKSTLLDAICLALYGATPRLGTITEANNEIMARGTAFCSASLTFEVHGKSYASTWSQKRAHGKITGNMGKATHELASVADKQILFSKKSETLAAIEKLTGLDFTRFTRSVLLAQGEFDAFLSAKAAEKSTILAQITGTEIYSDISRQVYETSRQHKYQLSVLTQSLSDIALLSDSEYKQCALQRDQFQQLHQRCLAQVHSLESTQRWHERQQQLNQQLAATHKAQLQHQQALQDFASDATQLQDALRAQQCHADYTQWHSNHLQLQQLSAKAKAVAQQLNSQRPQAASALADQVNSLETLKAQQIKYEQQLQLIQEATLLDNNVQHSLQNVQQKEQACAAQHTLLAKAQQQLVIATEAERTLQKEQLKAQGYANSNAPDSQLATQLPQFVADIERLVYFQQQCAHSTQQLKDTQKVLDALQQQLQASNQQLSHQQTLQQQLQQQQQDLEHNLVILLEGNTKSSYEREKETLAEQLLLLSTIKSLSQHRQDLVDGQPCPLCGSPTHPYAQQQLPQPDTVQLRINALTTLLEQVTQLQQQQQDLRNTIQQQSVSATQVQATQSGLQQQIEHYQNMVKPQQLSNLQQHQLQLAQLQHKCAQLLQQYGLSMTDNNLELENVQGYNILLEQLNLKAEYWTRCQEKLTNVALQLVDARNTVEHLTKQVAEAKLLHQQYQTQLQHLTEQHTTLSQQRQALLPGIDCQQAKRNAEAVLIQAQQRYDLHLGALQQQQKTQDRLQGESESLAAQIQAQQQPLQQLQQQLNITLQKHNFESVAQYQSAILSTVDITTLQQQNKYLDTASTEIATTLKHITEAQQQHNTVARAEVAPEALADQLATAVLQAEQQLQALLALDTQLSRHNDNVQSYQQQQQALSDQRKLVNDWELLDKLIGQADGQKFSKYAQQLSFDSIIYQANIQLTKMTDRYQLAAYRNEELALAVIDHYQAAELRPVKNLSGGESFMVSLALALGLASMSSDHVDLNCLFLDEGFGTLDESALDAALSMLAGLHHQGKIIGIISHISQLKERIYTQIQVTPISDGKSTVTGPGCTFVK